MITALIGTVPFGGRQRVKEGQGKLTSALYTPALFEFLTPEGTCVIRKQTAKAGRLGAGLEVEAGLRPWPPPQKASSEGACPRLQQEGS